MTNQKSDEDLRALWPRYSVLSRSERAALRTIYDAGKKFGAEEVGTPKSEPASFHAIPRVDSNNAPIWMMTQYERDAYVVGYNEAIQKMVVK